MKLKTFLLLASCIIIVSLSNTWILHQPITFLTIIDNIFLTSLTSTIVGASLVVVQGGLFNGIAYSFKRFFARVTKNGVYAFELDGDLEYVHAPTYTFTYPLLLAGILGCSVTAILSIVFYL
ncbi:DUF3899 domain-containing protein [Lysinibacillus fusiformis]|uniref:DUF3899 domain-containing protein n=1 Tax=Lysinibacillus fusiformis TaxID=28031 RepID=UPI0020BEE66E|nr:DUF3899 domain-containing protein [Lysinibacillus fusiformis]